MDRAPRGGKEASVCPTIRRLFALLMPILVFVHQAEAQEELPVLETYSFQLGDSGGVELTFLDPSIKRGGAQCRFTLHPTNVGEYHMRLEVFRHVKPDVITFALLLERIEVAFWDSQGKLVRQVVIDRSLGPDGLFIIGDSADGYFQHRRTEQGLATARHITIRLLGNYE
jgi:hypothetical protein